MGIIDQSGILAIATRMQRLSDQIRKDGFLIYKEHGIDFQPKWFPVIYTLHFKPVLSVVELAAEIGYTHPSTITLLKELEKEKLIHSQKDKDDERKRMIRLTDKGIEMIEKMEPVWQIITKAVTELTDTKNNLMKAIIEVEDRLKEKGLLEIAKSISSEKNS